MATPANRHWMQLKALPTEVAKAPNGMPFGLPERGAPELLALLTFVAGFMLLSDAVVGVAFGGTIFYWTCVGALAGYAGVLLGFLTGLPLVLFLPVKFLPENAKLLHDHANHADAEKDDDTGAGLGTSGRISFGGVADVAILAKSDQLAWDSLLPPQDQSFVLLSGPDAVRKCGQLLTLIYLTMDACLAGGVMGAALAGSLGMLLELYYAPSEGEFYAERDIHHVMPAFNYALFVLVYSRNLFKTLTGWIPRLVDEMGEFRPKEPLDALF